MNKFGLSLIFFAILFACNKEIPDTQTNLKEPNLPEELYKYSEVKLPAGVFPAQNDFNFIFEHGVVTPNIITEFGILEIDDATATLGRVLFYDKNLSLNNSISCGSCHRQDKAFSDGLALSRGFEGRMTTRSSMAFNNPISQRNLFWDSRSFSLADLALKPVQNHIEMGMEDINALANKLSKIPYYKPLFNQAFGDELINEERLSMAISQFVASITTSNSKFDQSIRTNDASFDLLTDLERMGQEIFISKGRCNSCHGGNNFAALDGPFDPYGGGGGGGEDLRGTTNIGLDVVSKDAGKNDGTFKIPSLRNIALTAPYMHDGRFKTLDEVIEHYNSGIQPNVALDDNLKDENGHPIQLNLNLVEKRALIAFLNTLTDTELTTDPKWSDPFK